jgi:hypothetical protein
MRHAPRSGAPQETGEEGPMGIGAPLPFASGDWVTYRKQKYGPSPGPRAEEVSATPRGENYIYVVEKFWIVQEILPDGRLRLRTRRGKEHVVAPDDPNLCRAGWWDRLVHRGRFLEVERSLATA